MAEFFTSLLTQLEPVIGLLVAGLGMAVIYLWRDNVRLREERNVAVEQKDVEIKSVHAQKDSDIKELTNTVIELQKESIKSTNVLANNVMVNTEVTKRVDAHLEASQSAITSLVVSVNTVLSNARK